jgi:hypothetical protein
MRTAEKWRTGSGRLTYNDASFTPGLAQPGLARGTPHRCLFRCALAFPAHRCQVQPVYLLPNGSQAPSDATGDARGAEYPRQHRQTPFPRLCNRRGIRQKSMRYSKHTAICLSSVGRRADVRHRVATASLRQYPLRHSPQLPPRERKRRSGHLLRKRFEGKAGGSLPRQSSFRIMPCVLCWQMR